MFEMPHGLGGRDRANTVCGVASARMSPQIAAPTVRIAPSLLSDGVRKQKASSPPDIIYDIILTNDVPHDIIYFD
jgi:hypothetical protein